MKEVQSATLKKTIALLTAMGCKFAVIDPDGEKHGDLEIIEPKERKRATPAFPRGEVHDYFIPFIENLQIGEVAEIPGGKYGAERIRGSICSWFVRHYGKGSANTVVVGDNVQVLRTL